MEEIGFILALTFNHGCWPTCIIYRSLKRNNTQELFNLHDITGCRDRFCLFRDVAFDQDGAHMSEAE